MRYARAARDGARHSRPGRPVQPDDRSLVPHVLWFDGAGFADQLRTFSFYRKLGADVREPLLDAIAERIRTRLDDRVPRRYGGTRDTMLRAKARTRLLIAYRRECPGQPG